MSRQGVGSDGLQIRPTRNRALIRARLLTVVLAGLLLSSPNAQMAAAADWPQWRGPDRTNVSKETGLLKEWPKNGPPLLWKAEGLGQGVASVSAAGRRVFTLGYRGDGEFVTALDTQDGKQLWSTRIGPAVKEIAGMRWLSQRTPTVDGERLYAFTAAGKLICLESASGKECWRKDYVKDFEGKKGRFGYCDYPLVDGDRLICTPGGSKSAVVALNKATGHVLWKSAEPVDQAAAYSVTVAANSNGTRQYVACLDQTVVGVAAADGKLLWRNDRLAGGFANRSAPIVRDNYVFFTNSNSGGGGSYGLLKLTSAGTSIKAEEMWVTKKRLAPWLLSPVLIGDHVYLCLGSGRLACIEFTTGKVAAEGGIAFGQCSLTYADGRLYVRNMTGKVALVEARPTGFQGRGAFDPPRPSKEEPSGVFPVVANGRLYLRDMDVLLCYLIQEPGSSGSE
jgi:outer membrane protein assembly factor BamB